MGKKEEYRLANEMFMKEMAEQPDVKALDNGVLYKVVQQGEGEKNPLLCNVVSCHYKGTLINGREFDNSWKRREIAAFRLSQVIKGWQIALKKMHVGDRWIIYIPWTQGYGQRTSGPIPAYSTLIFEVHLLGIA